MVEEDGPDADLLVKRGREELSQCVEMVTAVTQRPKPIHATQPIHSMFWASSDAMDDSEDEDPSTPEFVQLALEAGYSIDELVATEDALNAGNSSNNLKSAHSIVSNLVNRKITGGAPWQGPLPPPRISPPRTLGDFFAKASYRRSSVSRSPAASPALGSVVRGSMLTFSKNFEKQQG